MHLCITKFQKDFFIPLVNNHPVFHDYEPSLGLLSVSL